MSFGLGFESDMGGGFGFRIHYGRSHSGVFRDLLGISVDIVCWLPCRVEMFYGGVVGLWRGLGLGGGGVGGGGKGQCMRVDYLSMGDLFC